MKSPFVPGGQRKVYKLSCLVLGSYQEICRKIWAVSLVSAGVRVFKVLGLLVPGSFPWDPSGQIDPSHGDQKQQAYPEMQTDLPTATAADE